MLRRITIEVDDLAFHAATQSAGGQEHAKSLLADLVDKMTYEGQRTEVAGLLPLYGITLIMDEQID